MESTSKIKLDVQTLSAITEAHLGTPARSATELADGWFNTIYRIDLSDGRSVVIKMAPPPGFRVMRYEANLMQTEVDVLRLLEQTDGVPVPRVLAYDTSGGVHPHEFFLMEFVEGTTYSAARETLPNEVRSKIDAELGDLSARVNAIEGQEFGRCTPDQCTRPTWSQSVLAMADDVLEDAAEMGATFPIDHARVRAAFENARTELDEVTSPRLVLWDLHPGNVFVADNHVSAFIDVDRALWGDPLMEFFFRTIGNTSNDFAIGYGNPDGMHDRPGAPRRIWLYDLYLAMILITECSFRGYPQQHLEWANNEFRRVVGIAEPGWL